MTLHLEQFQDRWIAFADLPHGIGMGWGPERLNAAIMALGASDYGTELMGTVLRANGATGPQDGHSGR